MSQPATCTYCDRPAKHATLVRVGEPRASAYSDPERSADKDRSHIEVVRYCGVEHKVTQVRPDG